MQQLARLKRENPKVQVLPFSDAVLQAFGVETFKLYKELAEKDEDFKKIWASYLPFLKAAADYSAKTDIPLMNARSKLLV